MTTQEIINDMRSHTITSMRAAADRLEELQRLNDSMQTDRDIWIQVGREKLKAVEKERDEARAAMIEAKRQRDLYRTQRDATHADAAQARAEVERLKETVAAYEQATVKQSLTVRLDPSRLEIAAMLKAGWFANRDADFNATDHKWWIEQADALIAAAREAK